MNSETILLVVSNYFGQEAEEVSGRNRHKEVRHPRQIGVTISRLFATESDAMVGATYGIKRCAVVQTFTKVIGEIRIYKETRQDVVNICNLCGLPGDFIIGFSDYFWEHRATVRNQPKYMLALIKCYQAEYRQTRLFNHSDKKQIFVE